MYAHERPPQGPQGLGNANGLRSTPANAKLPLGSLGPLSWETQPLRPIGRPIGAAVPEPIPREKPAKNEELSRGPNPSCSKTQPKGKQ